MSNGMKPEPWMLSEFYFNGVPLPPTRFYIDTFSMSERDRNVAVTRLARQDPLKSPGYVGTPGRYEIFLPRDYFLEIMKTKFHDFIDESIDERRTGILDESQHWIVDDPGSSTDIRLASHEFLQTFFTEFMWDDLLEQLSSRLCGRAGTIFVESVDSISVGDEGVRLVGNAFDFVIHPVTKRSRTGQL